jgi:hypothetical protein
MRVECLDWAVAPPQHQAAHIPSLHGFERQMILPVEASTSTQMTRPPRLILAFNSSIFETEGISQADPFLAIKQLRRATR